MATMPDPSGARTVVLGLGNPLMGDDGLGLAVLARLREGWELPEVELVEDASQLVLLDAIRTRAPSGTVIELERDQLPRYLAHKLSPHQIDLKEVLALAELRGTLPERTVAIGAEPEAVELSTDLSPPLAGAVDAITLAVVARLGRWPEPHARAEPRP
jgi:hydrogenase maturation protease